MIVLDASVVIDIVTGTQDGREILRRITDLDEEACAPELVDVEVLQVLRRMDYREELSPVGIANALDLLGQLPLLRYGHQRLRRAIWALRYDMTAYGACYVALAARLDAPLWTRDRKYLSANTGVVDIIVL